MFIVYLYVTLLNIVFPKHDVGRVIVIWCQSCFLSNVFKFEPFIYRLRIAPNERAADAGQQLSSAFYLLGLDNPTMPVATSISFS